MHGDAVSATGSTRTAPAADALPERLRVAFASCQRWEHGHYAAWRHVRADAPDLVLFLGDYIYEYASPRDSTGLARVHGLRLATTPGAAPVALHAPEGGTAICHRLEQWVAVQPDRAPHVQCHGAVAAAMQAVPAGPQIEPGAVPAAHPQLGAVDRRARALARTRTAALIGSCLRGPACSG